VNTSSTEPITFGCAVLPLVQAQAVSTPFNIADLPRAYLKHVGFATGVGSVSFTRTFNVDDYLGTISTSGSEFKQTYSQALSSAVQSDFPAIYCGTIASKTGATWTGIMEYRLTYRLEWTELTVPGVSSLLGREKPEPQMEVASDDDDDFGASCYDGHRTANPDHSKSRAKDSPDVKVVKGPKLVKRT